MLPHIHPAGACPAPEGGWRGTWSMLQNMGRSGNTLTCSCSSQVCILPPSFSCIFSSFWPLLLSLIALLFTHSYLCVKPTPWVLFKDTNSAYSCICKLSEPLPKGCDFRGLRKQYTQLCIPLAPKISPKPLLMTEIALTDSMKTYWLRTTWKAQV